MAHVIYAYVRDMSMVMRICALLYLSFPPPSSYDSLLLDSIVLCDFSEYRFHDYDISMLPTMTWFVYPVYPHEAIEAGLEGRVVVRVLVDENGNVVPGTESILSSTDTIFNKPALEAALTCRFTPVKTGGRVWVNIPYSFRIREKANYIRLIEIHDSGEVEIRIEVPDSLRGRVGFISMSGPGYPRKALGQEGEVVVELDMNPNDGKVIPGSVKVISSSSPLFNSPVAESAGLCVLSFPGELKRPVRMRIIYSFRMRGRSYGE